MVIYTYLLGMGRMLKKKTGQMSKVNKEEWNEKKILTMLTLYELRQLSSYLFHYEYSKNSIVTQLKA